jgi:CspA family cold shock protein
LATKPWPPNLGHPNLFGLRRQAPGKLDLSRRQSAGNRIMLKSIRTGFTFRFREWLRRSDKASNFLTADQLLSLSVQMAELSGSEFPVGPIRRVTRSGGAVRGRSFPMAMTGTVKFFNGERGYGFIKPDDGGRDVFVHITAVERAGLKDLTEGQRITFEVEPDKKGKGPKAVNLVVS